MQLLRGEINLFNSVKNNQLFLKNNTYLKEHCAGHIPFFTLSYFDLLYLFSLFIYLCFLTGTLIFDDKLFQQKFCQCVFVLFLRYKPGTHQSSLTQYCILYSFSLSFARSSDYLLFSVLAQLVLDSQCSCRFSVRSCARLLKLLTCLLSLLLLFVTSSNRNVQINHMLKGKLFSGVRDEKHKTKQL